MEIKEIVNQIVAAKSKCGGIKEVYFVACGGSLGALYPAKVFLETEAVNVRVGWYNSNEFLHNTPKAFGENSVLVLTSHRGNTPETVKAAELGKKSGVPVIALTYVENSPISQFGDYMLSYSFGDEKDVAQEKTMQVLSIAVEILNQLRATKNIASFVMASIKLMEL